MSHTALRRSVVASVAVVAALLMLSAGSAQAARSFSTGIIDSSAFQYDGPVAFKHAKATGAKYLKNNLYWDHVVANDDSNIRPGSEAEPFLARDPGSTYYDWSIYDQLVREATANGMTPILTVVNSPKWARLKCTNVFACSPKPADYADFATAAATRYSGSFDPGDGQGTLPRVSFWQAWVEPNLYHFYMPIFKNRSPVSPNNYRVILNRFYEAIHAVNNSNTVLAAGLAPNGVPGKAIAPMTFTRQILCMGGTIKNPKPKRGCNAVTKADVWAIHPYTTGAPTHLPSSNQNMSVAALPRMVKLIRAANRAGKLKGKTRLTPLWSSEFSWDSSPPDPGGLKPNILSRWVAQAMYLMYKAQVNTMIWFGMRDPVKSPGMTWGESMDSGLYLRGKTIEQDTPKKVFRVYRFPFYAQMAKNGFSFWGKVPDANTTSGSNRKSIVLLARKRGSGGYVKVKSVRANVNGIFTGLVRGRGYTKSGAVMARVVSGGETSVPFGLFKTKDFYQPPFGGR